MKKDTNFALYRKQNHYSQAEIAELLGCSISAYSKYENGDREPSIRVLVSLSDIFGISVDELIGHKVLSAGGGAHLSAFEKETEDELDDEIISMAKYTKSFDMEKAKQITGVLAFKLISDYNEHQDCASVNDVFRLIDFLLEITDSNVVDLIDILGVSKSGYYHWRKNGDVVRKRNKPIAELILEYENAALDSAGYSSVAAYLRTLPDRPELRNISVARVKRIMDEFEIMPEDLRAKKNKLIQNVVEKYHVVNLPTAKNLLNRQFDYDVMPCSFWCIDITEIQTEEGKIYLCAIIDLCGRYLIGYSIDSKMDAFLVKKAIRRAHKNAELYGKSSKNTCMLHSDRGVQFRGNEIQNLIEKREMIQSMSRPFQSNDNACIEAFFSSLKCEYLYRFNLNTVSVTTQLIDRYISFYNTIRVHQTIIDVPFRYWVEKG